CVPGPRIWWWREQAPGELRFLSEERHGLHPFEDDVAEIPLGPGVHVNILREFWWRKRVVERGDWRDGRPQVVLTRGKDRQCGTAPGSAAANAQRADD